MTKSVVNKIILYIVIAVLVIGAGAGVWAIIRHYGKRETGDKLLVYTSMYPLYNFTREIGGDKVEVINIVPEGGEAHHYEPSGKMIAQMEDADLIIVTGAGMEHWLEDISGNQKIQSKLVITSSGVTLIEGGHDDGEEGHEEGHDHEYDPHIWLSLTNARIQAENILNALKTLDGENADYYQRNFDAYAVMIDGLKIRYDALLENLSTTTFIVSHKAFGYIAHEYGLTQIALTSIMSTGDVSGSSIQNAIDNIRSQNLKVIFYSSQENSQIVEQIASQTSVRVDILNTIESLSAKDKELGYDYLKLMARNLIALSDALA